MANQVYKIPEIQITKPAPMPRKAPTNIWLILAVVAGVILLAGK